MKIWRNGWTLIKETFSEWFADKAPRLGAALSYYTVFALAPVLLVVIAVAGLVLGPEAAQGKIVEQLSGLLGEDAASIVQTMLVNANRRGTGVMATVIGIATLLVGATGVMVELQAALNTVWKVIPKPGQAVKMLIRSRLIGLGLVLSMGFLLLVSLVISAALAAVSEWLSDIVPEWLVLGYLINYGISIFVIALFFALIFKVLPDAKVSWHDVWIGAFVTSLLFHLGKFLIGLYLGQASVASAFGAAGSLAVLLVWVYYSAQIVLLGAEFTRSYANRFGSHVVPEEHAVEAPHGAEERLAAERSLHDQHQADAAHGAEPAHRAPRDAPTGPRTPLSR
jgi:membrane protein